MLDDITLLGGIDVSTSILSPDADIVVGECTTLDASVTGDRGPENSGSELGGKEAALVILSGNSIAGRGVDDKTWKSIKKNQDYQYRRMI
jgi:hypothetical protein